MAALTDNSVRVFSNGNVTSLESAAWTLAGSNRVLYTQVASGAGTPVAPASVLHGGSGGTSLTQIGTTNTVGTFGRHGVYRLIAPASGSQTSYASWGSNQDETLIISVSVKDADQSTPNNTLAAATGSNSNPTVNATSVSGDLVLDFQFWLDGNGNGLAQAPNGSQTALQEIEGSDLFYEGMGASYLTASGTSTTMAWTLSGFTLGNTNWSTYACAINAAGGGGGPATPAGRLSLLGVGS
jgi:hypothetical protein